MIPFLCLILISRLDYQKGIDIAIKAIKETN